MVKAICIKESVNKNDTLYYYIGHDLEVGKEYEVDRIEMGSSITNVYLKDKERVYNSVYLKFEENGKPIDIFKDRRFNPYIKGFIEGDIVDFETYTAIVMCACSTSAIIKYYYSTDKFDVEKVGTSEIRLLTPEEKEIRKDKIAKLSV